MFSTFTLLCVAVAFVAGNPSAGGYQHQPKAMMSYSSPTRSTYKAPSFQPKAASYSPYSAPKKAMHKRSTYRMPPAPAAAPIRSYQVPAYGTKQH